MMNRATLVVVLVMVVCICHVAVVAENSNYISVAALDKYGNAVQVQHAYEAATRYGIPVAAATCMGGVVVVSIRSLRPEI